MSIKDYDKLCKIEEQLNKIEEAEKYLKYITLKLDMTKLILNDNKEILNKIYTELDK